METKENDIIIFPNLENRLYDKGFDALHSKKFHDALDCFDQLLQCGLQNEQSEFAAVVCLMELNEWKEAKERCGQLLMQEDLFSLSIVETYISILVQLHDYETLVDVLETALLQDITEEQKEKLQHLFSFAVQMQQGPQRDVSEFIDVFGSKDVGKQLQALHLLRKQGVGHSFSFFHTFLKDPTQHPYVKTMVLHLLQEHRVQDEMTVVKYDQVCSIIPSELQSPPFYEEVTRQLEELLGQENPTLLQAILGYWTELQQLLYPMCPAPHAPLLWAVALIKIGYERFFVETVTEQYDLEQGEIERVYSQILQIEKEGFLPV